MYKNILRIQIEASCYSVKDYMCIIIAILCQHTVMPKKPTENVTLIYLHKMLNTHILHISISKFSNQTPNNNCLVCNNKKTNLVFIKIFTLIFLVQNFMRKQQKLFLTAQSFLTSHTSELRLFSNIN